MCAGGKLIERNAWNMNSIAPTFELLLGLGVASHNVVDPGISSTTGVSSPSMLAEDSSIAS